MKNVYLLTTLFKNSVEKKHRQALDKITREKKYIEIFVFFSKNTKNVVHNHLILLKMRPHVEE